MREGARHALPRREISEGDMTAARHDRYATPLHGGQSGPVVP